MEKNLKEKIKKREWMRKIKDGKKRLEVLKKKNDK